MMKAQGLLVRAAACGVALAAAVAAGFFCAAGSAHLWRGWAYLAVFCLCSAAITAFLLRSNRDLLGRRLTAGPQSETRSLQRWVQGATSVCFFLTFITSGLQVRLAGSTVPAPISILSDVLVGTGFLLVFFVFRANTFTSATVEVVHGQTVTCTGPYARVRHPMYSAAILLLAATPPALGSTWGWLAVAPLGALIVVRLLDEERLLLRALPGYRQYCETVRYRLIPGCW